jgi:acetyltransferase
MEQDDSLTFSPIVWKARDSSILTIRPISPGDVCSLLAFVNGLSFANRYFRFGNGEFNPSTEEAMRVCTPNLDECTHLVVAMNKGGNEILIGSSRYVIHSKTCCEFAIAVTDSWKHHGVGHRLMDNLIVSAKSRGMKQMYGKILSTNLDMIKFVSDFGFNINESEDGLGLIIATCNL